MIGIYCIRRRSNGKCYVGQSINIEKRFKDHKRWAHKNSYIERVIRKHGIDAFVWEILEICDEDVLNQREIHWIASLDTMKPNGYNLAFGGNHTRLTKEAREKIRRSKLGEKNPNYGRTYTPEERQRISESLQGENNPFYGKTHSPEVLRKISERHKGKKVYFSPEHRRKLSEARKGWVNSPETRRKLSEREITPEWRENMRKGQRKRRAKSRNNPNQLTFDF